MSLRENLQKLAHRSDGESQDDSRAEKLAKIKLAKIKEYAEKIWVEEILPGLEEAAKKREVGYCYSFRNKDYEIWDELQDFLMQFGRDNDLDVSDSVCDCLFFGWSNLYRS